MRHLAVLLLVAVALLFPPHASSVGEGPWEKLWGIAPQTIPDGSAVVGPDCDDIDAAPCYETVQAAITAAEIALPAGNRFVYIYPGTYTEDVDCDLGTGYTTLVGMGGSANPQVGAPNQPHIIGCSAADRIATPALCGASDDEDTLHMAFCAIDKLYIEQGPDALDTAIQTIDGAAGGDATHGIIITNSIISTNATVNGLGAGEHLISLEHTAGNFLMLGGRVSCGVMGTTFFVGTKEPDDDTACIYIDAANTGYFEFMRNEMAFVDLVIDNQFDAFEYAFAEVKQGPGQILFADNVIYAETRTAALQVNSMFEIADTIAEVPHLNIHGNTYAGGVIGAPAEQSDHQAAFMRVIDAGTTANVFLGDIDNPEAFVLPSTWGGVMPNWMGSCDHPFYAEFDPDPTKLVGTPEYVSIYDSSVGAEAAVDQYIVPTAVIPHKLNVLLNIGPGAGDAWYVRLNADTSNTGLTCAIVGTNTTCTSADAIAAPVARGSKLDLMVYCNAGNCANDATSMIVTGCLGDIPQ